MFSHKEIEIQMKSQLRQTKNRLKYCLVMDQTWTEWLMSGFHVCDSCDSHMQSAIIMPLPVIGDQMDMGPVLKDAWAYLDWNSTPVK